MTRRRRIGLALLLLCSVIALVAPGAAFAGGPTPISILAHGHAGSRAEMLEDPSGEKSAEEIARSGSFESIDPAHANRGYSAATFWVRLTLVNPSAEAETAILELAATPTRAELYDAAGARLLARSGALLPFDARPVHHSNIAFRTVMSAGETRTFLIRLVSNDTVFVDPIVWREESFWLSVQRIRLLDGVYYGIILGLALYNLFLAFATRERAYLAYVGFQVAMALANAAIDKYSFRFFWPGSPIWAARSEQVFDMVALAAAISCARGLLDLPTRAPRLDRALRAVVVLAALLAIVSAGVDATPTFLFAIAGTFFGGITMLVVAASVVARAGDPHARIFLAAWSVLFAGVFGAGLCSIGAVQSLAGYDLLKIGSAAEALLLSIGLAARIRTMQRERTRAQEELLMERSRRIASLSQLVAGVAHEIGNPLNFAKGGAGAIGSSIEILERSTSKSDAITKATTSARRALVLVESGLDRIGRMLRHLRSDLGDRQAHAAVVDPRGELDDALEVLALLLDERKITVVRDDRGGPLRVLARAGDLAQVFANLVRNAADAMGEGGRLEVTTSLDDHDVVIVFHDDGPGVAEEIRGSIFDPFFTTRAASDDAGTGLGLYVSREIVARWGGTLTLATREHGATFVVRVPTASED